MHSVQVVQGSSDSVDGGGQRSELSGEVLGNVKSCTKSSSSGGRGIEWKVSRGMTWLVGSVGNVIEREEGSKLRGGYVEAKKCVFMQIYQEWREARSIVEQTSQAQ